MTYEEIHSAANADYKDALVAVQIGRHEASWPAPDAAIEAAYAAYFAAEAAAKETE